VERRLKEALKHDRARIQVGHISHFGLLEMSRQRIRSSVLESSTEKCPVCGGSGHVRSVSSVTLALLRAIEETLIKGPTHNLIVRTRPEVALYILNHKRSHLRALEERFRLTIMINSDPSVIGTQSYVVERAEQVHTPEAARAIATETNLPLPPIEEDDSDLPPLEESSEDAAAPEFSGTIPVSTEDHEHADSAEFGEQTGQGGHGGHGGHEGERDGRGRRRRRRGGRGRGRGRDREHREPMHDDGNGMPSHAQEGGEGAFAQPHEQAEHEGGEPHHEHQGQQGEGHSSHEGEGARRRRRGRRGGRRNRGRNGNGGGNGYRPHDQQGQRDHQEEPANFGGDSFEPAPQQREPVSHSAPPVPAEQPAPEPVAAAEAPRRRSTTREPAPTSSWGGSTSSPTPAAAPSTAEPVVNSGADAPSAPKRGWWGRKLLGDK
ncbi:MAG: ribonuclease E/G, partial [Pseudolabrys sp.]|nr:ribonuclease E/G [Pseudolabrys sp.]